MAIEFLTDEDQQQAVVAEFEQSRKSPTIQFLDEAPTSNIEFVDEQQGAFMDVLEQIPTGVVRAGAEFLSATNAIAGWLEENVASLGTVSGEQFKPEEVEKNIEAFKAELPKADTTAGKIAGTLAQFVAPMGIASKALKTAGMSNVLLRGYASGAIADFTAFDAHEERLSNILSEMDNSALNNMATRYLASDKDDTELEGRMKQVIEGMALGGLAGTLFEALRMGKAGIMAKANASKAEKVMPKIQEAAGRYRELGLNPQESLKRALRATKVSEARFDKLKEIRPVDLTDDVIKSMPKTETVTKQMAKEITKRKKSYKEANVFSNALVGLREKVSEISQPVAHALNKFELSTHLRSQEARESAKPFMKSFNKLSSSEQKEFKLLWLNEDAAGLSKFMRDRGDLADSFTPVKDMLKGMGTDAKKFGAIEGGAREGYLPRLVLSRDDLLTTMQLDAPKSDLFKLLDDAADDVEATEIINQYMRTRVPETMRAGLPGHGAKRQIDWEITPAMAEHYADPIETLGHYINTMSDNIEKRKFLGYKPAGDGKTVLNVDGTPYKFAGAKMREEDLKASIGNVLATERSAGNITEGEVHKLTELLHARMGPGEQSMTRRLQAAKNFMYMGLLANPVSAVTQLGDVALAAHINGIGDTIVGLAKGLAKKGLAKEDLGISQHAEDMMNSLKSHQWLDKTMKWSGFQAMDNLGKATLINGSLRKYQKLANTPKGLDKIVNQYKHAFDKRELGNLIQGLQKGKITPEVKYVLWNDLTKMQPVSLSEMPEMYLRNPNGRVIYALKTFTVKQLNRMYFDGIKQMQQGNLKAGAGNLMRFAGLLTAGGMATDTIKDTMQNREPKNFDDLFVSNLFKVAGTSDYVARQIEKGDIEGALSSTIMPPLFPMGMTMGRDIAGDKDITEWKSFQYVPVVGRLYHQWFGGGAEAHNERVNKE